MQALLLWGKSPRLEKPALFSVGDTLIGGAKLTPEHQAVEDISPVLRRSPPLLVVRYCSQVRAVSYASIPNYPNPQASMWRSILYLIVPEPVTCRLHWIITVYNTVNLSAF